MIEVTDLWRLCCLAGSLCRVSFLELHPCVREELFEFTFYRIVHEFFKHPLKVGEGIVPVVPNLLNEGEDDGTPPARLFVTDHTTRQKMR